MVARYASSRSSTITMASWLNKEFMTRVLRNSENDDTICVTAISTAPATNKGDNYTSVIIRVSVDFIRRQQVNIITDKRSIIIKTEVDDDSQRKMFEQIKIFNVEIVMMTTILKEMNSILEDTKLSSECLFTQQNNPALLVLEDLAALGFHMVNRLNRLDFQHSILALTNLAKFHAASVAICEQTPKYKDILFDGLFHPNTPPEFIQFFFITRMKGLAKAVASWPGFGESYSDKLMKLSDVISDQVADCQKRDNNEFNVINHNDFWTNNMLFKYDDDGKVIEHIIVDFQACYYASPAIDLTNFLNICISESVSDSQRNEFVGGYLEKLTTTMYKLGCKTRPPNMAELNKAMHQREIYGLLVSCAVLPFNIVDRRKVGSDKEVYEDEIFKAELSKKLLRWNSMGLLD